MLPSSTVENYLKAIYQAQAAAPETGRLVPMGQLSSALGVVPGTATTMVKALAESGLVAYEPYAGVRLTAAGERLAALVLRRHRLIELFLVQVMGMSWDEVHEEAEQLEHAVSDRLIARIDAMLGRPATDPHGDPIPGPEGTVHRRDCQTLLDCPMHTPVVVTRVTDQDAQFLRFIESSDLKPGQAIEIEARDAASDSVRVRSKDDRRITIGMRAASKLLVEAVTALLLTVLSADGALAQTPAAPAPPAPTGSSRPFEIMDNSFLVEEAFNQPKGIFQSIFGLNLSRGDEWGFAFTQEWPIGSQAHQFSYTIPLSATVTPGLLGTQRGLGDIFINYRYQALMEGPGRPAFSPRVSLVLPTGAEERALGDGSAGLQFNLPFSKQQGDVYWHWNAGLTWLPHAYAGQNNRSREAMHESLLSPFLAASAIWRVRPMTHLMLESVADFAETTAAFDVTEGGYEKTVLLSPGFRHGWNVGDRQIVAGLALPIVLTETEDRTGLFVYFSYELPFKK